MADNKYFWIKLKTDFFSQETIDFLMAQKNGCEYIVLYQMLCLNTVNNEGKLLTKIGEMIVPYDINKIVRDTKYFDYDTVTLAVTLFKKLGLVYEDEDGVLSISGFKDMIGKCSDSTNAERQRRFRERQRKKQLLEMNSDVISNVTDCNNSNVTRNVTDRNESNVEYRDKRLEIRDKSIESIESSNVTCNVTTSTPPLREKLIYEYGQEAVDDYVRRVTDWCKRKGKPLTDVDITVRKWMSQDNIKKIDHSVDKYKEAAMLQSQALLNSI